MSSKFWRSLAAFGLAVAMAAAAPASAVAQNSSSYGRTAWVAGWGASMQSPAEIFGPSWSVQGFADHSVRQVVRVSTGGSLIRLRLSNVYGSAPLRVAGATIGKAGDGAAVRPGSLRPVTFGHSLATTVQTGGELVSDPVVLFSAPLDRLSVTLYFAEPTGPATFHSSALATSYRTTGDHRFDARSGAFIETTQSWYYLAGVEMAGGAHRGTVVTLGDSITDGYGATPDADNRYPDELAERLLAAHRPTPVVNAGIGGNRVLNDSPCFGEKAITRFQRDVANQPGVRTVIVLEGINDIGFSLMNFGDCNLPNPHVTAQQLIDGHRALIAAAHARGIKIIGATVLPIKGSFYDASDSEAVRDALNEWIRTSGEYDDVADLDRATADPADPDRLNPAYDSGDALHPNDAGYHAMADAVDLGSL
jgi:lysophospholipase L1-like esterase